MTVRLPHRVLACLGACLMSAGCTLPGGLHFSPEARSTLPEFYIADVPFYPQESDQCGPASLAAVLNYWGLQATPEQISRAVYKPRWKGTPGMDMWTYATARQMDVRMRSASLDDLRKYLEKQIPVIAFLDRGNDWFPSASFVVVVGLDPGAQIVVTQNGKEHKSRIPYRQFVQAWQKTNNWTLVVRPKSEG